MALAEFVGVVQDVAGNAQVGTPITVTLVGGGAATIYATTAGGTPLTSLASDVTGTFRFAADNSVSYVITPSGFAARTVTVGGSGAPGATGATGATGPPGVGANWRGVWSSATTYALNDGVTTAGRNYISNISSNLNHAPVAGGDANWADLGPTSTPGNFTINGQLIMPAHGVLQAIVDNADHTRDGLSFYRRLNQISGSSNGSNGPRGDAISNGAANVAGSFAIVDQFQLQHDTKGSMQGPTVVGTINEVGAGGIYGEMGLYEASLTINRQGAYAAQFEGTTIINSGKQARGAGLAILMQEANALSTYTMLDSVWNDTGSRGLWIANTGAAALGTAIYLQGGASADFERGIYWQVASQAKPFLYSKQAGAASPFWTVNGLGDATWGSTTAQDVKLSRFAAGALLVTGLAASAAALGVNPSTAGQQAVVNLYDAGTLKWQVGKQTDNSFFVYDVAGGTVPISAATGNKLNFFGGSPIVKPTVTGSRGGNAALASALTALAQLGLVTDSSTA